WRDWVREDLRWMREHVVPFLAGDCWATRATTGTAPSGPSCSRSSLPSARPPSPAEPGGDVQESHIHEAQLHECGFPDVWPQERGRPIPSATRSTWKSPSPKASALLIACPR